MKVTPTLGLTGATVNAMALIAPGAFLWITYQLQAAATAPDGSSVASDMWPGIVLALVIALLSAMSYAELARKYPEAGFGSCYYFAGQANRQSRVAKLATGWAAHLYYWVYPGTMVAFMATLVGYIYTEITGATVPTLALVFFSVGFALLAGYVAVRGVTGSTLTALAINIVQLVMLVVFSIVAIFYRTSRVGTWAFSNAVDVIRPHSVQGVLIQSTLAILILVGFESCTALAAETKDAHRNIPRAVILSLVIQGVFAYLLEYFAANYVQTSIPRAAASAAPIGDLAILIGNRLFMVSIAITVLLALLGTTLSCINTAARVSYAMAKDREMPELLAALHGRFASPSRAVWALVAFSCVIATIGVQSVNGLTGIALASNFGTFALYGMTCLWTYIAFARDPSRKLGRHAIVPMLGLVTNAGMLVAILYFAGKATYICFGIVVAWALVSIAYVASTSAASNSRSSAAV